MLRAVTWGEVLLGGEIVLSEIVLSEILGLDIDARSH